MTTGEPGVGTNGSSPGFAAWISLKPRSYWRAISMSDSPAFTARTQTRPMTSWAEQSPKGRHAGDLLTSHVSSAGPDVGLASDTGGAWAHPAWTARARRSARTRARRAGGEIAGGDVDEESTDVYMPASGEGVN